MPIVSIKIAQGRTTDKKRKFAKPTTDLIVSILDVKPE